jgi:hypothetical protein
MSDSQKHFWNQAFLQVKEITTLNAISKRFLGGSICLTSLSALFAGNISNVLFEIKEAKAHPGL